MKNKSRNYSKFKPISKKSHLKLNNKFRSPTIFHYQKGYSNDKIALRIFKKDQIFHTLVSKSTDSWETVKKNLEINNKSNKPKDEIDLIWNMIQDYGGQLPEKAQMQREESLTVIVRNYFEKLGYKVEEQPKLKENTPDLLITKTVEKNGTTTSYACYIELKAYFGRTIVGEAEIAQILKYYALCKKENPVIKDGENELNINTPIKFMLITTGDLLQFSRNSFFNGDFSQLKTIENKSKQIKKNYKKYLKELGFPNNMEARDTRNIYRFAHKKVAKYKLALQSDFAPNVTQLQYPKSLDSLIENENKYDVILIPAEIFSQLLDSLDLKRELIVYNRISKSWLERLIFDRSLLEI